MAQEKHLPNDTTSLYVTEIKGDISNRIAISHVQAGDFFPESTEYQKSRRWDPTEAVEKYCTHAGCLSGRWSILQEYMLFIMLQKKIPHVFEISWFVNDNKPKESYSTVAEGQLRNKETCCLQCSAIARKLISHFLLHRDGTMILVLTNRGHRWKYCVSFWAELGIQYAFDILLSFSHSEPGRPDIENHGTMLGKEFASLNHCVKPSTEHRCCTITEAIHSTRLSH